MLIQILVTQEDGEWIAHALDFDLMAGGDSQDDALEAIGDMVDAYFEACAEDGLTLDQAKRPAPPEFFKRFDEAYKDPECEFMFLRRSFEYPEPKPSHKLVSVQ